MKKIHLLTVIILLFNCSNAQKKMEKIANLYKEVKYHQQAISYQAEYFIGGCNFEILINGFPIERYYGLGNGALSASVPINTEILKSGLQSWKIRIFPIHINGIPQKVIEGGARVQLKIQAIRFKDNGDIEKISTPVIDFEVPLKKEKETGKNIFVDMGKPYVEYSGTFQANVPYQLKGWQDGEKFDLSDSLNLKKEVLNKFNELRNMIINKEENKFEESILYKEKEVAQALFMTEKESKDIAKFYTAAFDGTLQNFNMTSIDNEELVYYCEDRVVTLLFTAMKCPRCKGEPVLVGRYEEENRKKVRIFPIYLYRSKGKKELEVIR